MDEKIVKFLGKQVFFDGSQASSLFIERAILRNDTLIIDWVDERRNRVLVTMKQYKGDVWSGKYEKGEGPKEEGSVRAKVHFYEDTLAIIGDLHAISGDSEWVAKFKRVDKFPDEK